MDRADLPNANSTLTKHIHYFLQHGDTQIKYSPNQDIVLVLGNTGSGKSTLTQYISGEAEGLISQEVRKDTGNFLIIDAKNKISRISTIVSHTIYPDLIEDALTPTLYYDCPGFSDTRSAAHEIVATYFIKKVIDSARAVKLVFVVNHNSVSPGENRLDFVLMLQHAIDFIKQLEKFKNSIALVVTKIDSKYVRGEMVSDEKVINAIGEFLQQVKLDIEQNTEILTSDNKHKAFSLLDIFLSKGENGNYTRIQIFRKPDESGPINNIVLLNEGKISLQNLINNNIKFVKAGDNDFGYTVSPKSKLHVGHLTEEINKTIVILLSNIGKDVQKYCVTQEEKTSDLEDFISIFQNLRDTFSKLLENAIKDAITPEMFIIEVENNIKNFQITIADNYFNAVRREMDYINFLNLVSNQSIKSYKSSLLASGLSDLTEYLNDSLLFYRFLYDMFQRLSEFEIQKKRNKFNSIHLNAFHDLFESPVFKEIESIFKQYISIKEMKLDPLKLALLNRVLDETLKNQMELNSPEINKVVAKGVNVILSDLSEVLGNNDIEFIEVYALHKVFIDTSLDLTGREIQMAIIAPVWEIVGSQIIILDGRPGMDYYQKASNGYQNGESGTDGQPGEPGGPSGNFIGLGKRFINEEYLRISANGGRGGRGQDGGDGADGNDGAHSSSCEQKNSSLITIFYNKFDVEYGGQDGGNGGNGGIGGYGGHKGFINIIKVGKEPRIVGAKKSALDGHPGENGKGGSGGRGGRYFNHKMRNYVIVAEETSFEPIDQWGNNGQPGKDGANLHLRCETRKLTTLLNINYIEINSRCYFQNKMNSSLQSKLLTTFLNEISIHLRIFVGEKRIEEHSRNINKHGYDTKEMRSRYYNQYVTQGKDSYYLDLYHLVDNSTTTHEPVSNNFVLETERINDTRTKPIFCLPAQSKTMKMDKNINDQYSSIKLHENILTDMVLKRLRILKNVFKDW